MSPAVRRIQAETASKTASAAGIWKICTNGRAPGLENRDVGREVGGGSNPLSSAQWRQQRVLHAACKAVAFGMVSSSLTASTRGFSPTYLLSVRWSRPETPTCPPSSADRASGSGPEGAWFESTGGHASRVGLVVLDTGFSIRGYGFDPRTRYKAT